MRKGLSTLRIVAESREGMQPPARKSERSPETVRQKQRTPKIRKLPQALQMKNSGNYSIKRIWIGR